MHRAVNMTSIHSIYTGEIDSGCLSILSHEQTIGMSVSHFNPHFIMFNSKILSVRSPKWFNFQHSRPRSTLTRSQKLHPQYPPSTTGQMATYTNTRGRLHVITTICRLNARRRSDVDSQMDDRKEGVL